MSHSRLFAITLSGAELFIKSLLPNFPLYCVEENPDFFIGDTEALRVHCEPRACLPRRSLLMYTHLFLCVATSRTWCPLVSAPIAWYNSVSRDLRKNTELFQPTLAALKKKRELRKFTSTRSTGSICFF